MDHAITTAVSVLGLAIGVIMTGVLCRRQLIDYYPRIGTGTFGGWEAIQVVVLLPFLLVAFVGMRLLKEEV